MAGFFCSLKMKGVQRGSKSKFKQTTKKKEKNHEQQQDFYL